MGEVLRPREGERPRLRREHAPAAPAITPERQPLVAPDTHHAQPAGQAPPNGRDPPVQGPAPLPPPLLGGDPENPLTRLAVGVGGMDRASPIVVHSGRPHKGVRYWLVTAG